MSETNGFVVEKNIPVPARYGSMKTNYPVDAMGIGDSFLLNTTSNKDAQTCRTLLNHKCGPGKFAIRKTPDGYRCWRVA